MYGSIDGVITATILVVSTAVAGVAPHRALAVGVATLVADSLSMALASAESVEENEAVMTALTTVGTFILGGMVPLVARWAAPSSWFAGWESSSTYVAVAASAVALFALAVLRRRRRRDRALERAKGKEGEGGDEGASSEFSLASDLLEGTKLVAFGAVAVAVSMGITWFFVGPRHGHHH